MTGQQRRLAAYRVAPAAVEHLPMRPLWLCRRCGQPWPCGVAKLALVAEYEDAPVSLFLYLAGCLHDAIDDLHRLNPSVTGERRGHVRPVSRLARPAHPRLPRQQRRRRADRGAVTVNGIGLIAEFVTALKTCAGWASATGRCPTIVTPG